MNTGGNNPLFLWCAALMLVSHGEARAVERQYSIQDFDEVRTSGPQNVTIEKGRGTSVRASGTREALDNITITSQGRSLIIQARARGGQHTSTFIPANVSITVPAVKSLRLVGSGSVNVFELRGPLIEVSLSGSGAIAVTQLDADRAVFRLTGSGSLSVSGRAKIVEAALKGSGDFLGESMTATDLMLTASLSGRAVMRASRSAKVTANGAGEIVVMGDPACVVQNLGAGTISCGR